MGDVPAAASPSGLSLTILCHERRHTIVVPPSTTIGILKRMLKEDTLADLASGKSMRVIFSGRMLSNESESVSTAGLRDGSIIHISLTDGPRGAHANVRSHVAIPIGPGVNTTSSRATAVEGVVDGAIDTNGAVQSPRMGFERLQAVGLNADDLAVLRATYLPDVQREMADLALQPNESEAHRLLRMEDEWMRRQGPFSEFAINLRPLLMARLAPQGGSAPYQPGSLLQQLSADGREEEEDDLQYTATRTPQQGTTASFIFGVMLGSIFGFFMLLWLTLPSLNRKFKAGILVGVSINIGLELWRLSAVVQAKGAAAGGTPTPNIEPMIPDIFAPMPPGMTPVTDI